MGRERQMGHGASKTTEERRGHRGSEKEREGQRSRWGCGGERGEREQAERCRRAEAMEVLFTSVYLGFSL